MKTQDELENDLARIENLKQLAIRQSWHNLVKGFDDMRDKVLAEIEKLKTSVDIP